MFDLDDCIAFITNKSAKKLADEFNRRLQEHGTTRVQWIALFYIGKVEDRMEKEELVERRKKVEDRRITKIVLTAKGKFLREELMPIGQLFHNDVLQGISKADLNVFKNVLKKMIDNVY